MSETPTLPTYDELVNAALSALNISTTILAAAETTESWEESAQIVATASLTVAGAQVFATLAQAAATLDAGWQPLEPVRTSAGSGAKPFLVKIPTDHLEF